MTDRRTVVVEHLTVKEFAERQRVHIQTVYTAIRENRLTFRVQRISTGKRAAIRILVPRPLDT